MNIVQDIATFEDIDDAVYLSLFNKVVTYADKDTPIPTEFYKVFGVQPDAVYNSQREGDIPRIRVIRKGGLQPGATGSAAGSISHVVKTRDGNDNPLTYDEVTGGSIGDILYDVRYISFNENDDIAIIAALTAFYPVNGIEYDGPENLGPFLFERQFHTDNLRRRKGELAGLFRIIARDICIGKRVTREAQAISDLNHTEEAKVSL